MRTATVLGWAAGHGRTYSSCFGPPAWFIAALAAAMSPAIGQTIEVTPPADTVFRFTGPEGGPFQPDTVTTWTVTDVDGTGLELNVIPDQPWLGTDPDSGTIPGPLRDSTLDVSAVLNLDQAELMAPGVYAATVSFRNLDTGQGDTERTVELVVAAAHFTVSPAFVNAMATVNGPSPPPVPVTLTAAGTGDLNYALSFATRSWFTVDKTAGTVPGGGSDTFTVFFNAFGLLPQTHTAFITIENLTNGAGRVRLPISLTISSASAGAVLLTPDEDLSIEGHTGMLSQAAQEARLVNQSDRFVLWQAVADEQWVSVSPAGGELAPKDGDTSSLDEQAVRIQANLAINNLEAGSHVGTVTFENLSTGVPIAMRIVRVLANPILTLPADSASGTVQASPSGEPIAFVPAKRLGYEMGTAVTLTAMPQPGFKFDGWVTDLELETGMENPLVVAMDASRTIGAVFAPIRQTLTLSVSGTGTGTVTPDPAGMVMENTLVFRYTNGQAVTLEAQADAGSIFAGWSGNVPPGSETENPLEVTMDRDRVITARFEPLVTLSVTVSGQGTVQVNPDQEAYAAGTTVTLVAEPDEGFEFAAWGGDAEGTTSVLSLTLSQSRNVTASFVPEGTGPSDGTTFRLFVDVSGDGVVSPSGGEFEAGSTVTLVATPGVDSLFAGWQGDADGTELVTTVLMDADKTVQAVFDADPDAGRPIDGGPIVRLCGAMGWSGLSIFLLSWVTLTQVRRRG